MDSEKYIGLDVHLVVAVTRRLATVLVSFFVLERTA
jgi:hypothetical protein